jgi:glutaredoxin
MTAPDSTRASRQIFGALAFFLGVTIFVLVLLEATDMGIPLQLPATWYTHRALWILIGAILFGAGWKLQKSETTSESASWEPSKPGSRFQQLVIYSREECHLCDDAKEILARYSEYLPELREVDIDEDPQLRQLHGTTIPVVEIDGEIRFRGRVDELLLRRLIEGTQPHTES